MRESFYFVRVSFAILCLVGGALAEATADTSTFIDNQGRMVTIIRQTPQPIPQSVKSISTSSSQNVTLMETAPNTAEVDSVRIYQYQIDKYMAKRRGKNIAGNWFLFPGLGVAAFSCLVFDDDVALGVTMIGVGLASAATGITFKIIGRFQRRRANMYQEKQDLYKISHARSQVSLQ
ncbi:MAG: hypothetical protein WCX75_08795, partial [Fibrobacteraceae bacterium]